MSSRDARLSLESVYYTVISPSRTSPFFASLSGLRENGAEKANRSEPLRAAPFFLNRAADPAPPLLDYARGTGTSIAPSKTTTAEAMTTKETMAPALGEFEFPEFGLKSARSKATSSSFFSS